MNCAANCFSEMSDLIRLLILQCIAVDEQQVEVVFKLSCVSQQWQQLCHDVVLTEYRSHQLQSNRFCRHFREDTSLALEGYSMIGDEGIRDYTNLTALSLAYNRNITDAGIATFSKLVSLDLRGRAETIPVVTPAGMAFFLTNLTCLRLGKNYPLTDDYLSQCTRLLNLDLEGNPCEISLRGLRPLTQLTALSLGWLKVPLDEWLVLCTGLTTLKLNYTANFSEKIFRRSQI
jgi:hypothetical protein